MDMLCFTSFDYQNLKYKLSGQDALDQHKLICGAHKPILPEIPKEGECVELEEDTATPHSNIFRFRDYVDEDR